MKRKRRRVAPAVVATNVLRAGAARADITPALGIPNAGYGIWGAEQVGCWQRLFASALVLETPATNDQPARRVAFVGTDLHAGTRYLHESVAERTASRGVTVDRLMIGATHTHNGPSGIYSDDFYDRQAGARGGFNERVVDWLVGRLADLVARACDSLVEARVGHGEARVWGWSWNRSLPAFERNGIAAAAFPAVYGGDTSGAQGLPDVEQAVDPRVRVMLARGLDGLPIGGFGTINVHNTSLLAMRDELSSDWFGWAVRGAQETLFERGGFWAISPRLPLAIVVGNAGDVNAGGPVADLYSARKSRELTRLVGDRYAQAIADACVAANNSASADVRVRARWVEAEATRSTPALAPSPRVGAPTLGGAEGLRQAYEHPDEAFNIEAADVRELKRRASIWLHDNHPEPSVSSVGGPHHPKRVFPEQTPQVPGAFVNLVKSMQGTANSLFPIRIFSVGTHHWVAVPGEPTTATGLQLERAARGVLGGTAAVVGVGGDYIGYFATTEEYDAQHYEGSSTLWGRNTADWLEARIRALAGRPPTSAPTGFAEFHKSSVIDWPRERGNRWIAPALTLKDGVRGVVWVTPKIHVWFGESPLVGVERQTANGWETATFRGAPIDDREQAIEIRRGESNRTFVWAATLDPPAGLRSALQGQQLRFRVVHPRFGGLASATSGAFAL